MSHKLALSCLKMIVGIEKMLYKSQMIIFLVKKWLEYFRTLIFYMNISKLAQILETSFKQALSYINS